MGPDQGGGMGIPGWFVAFFILVIVIGIGSFIWRISVSRKIAEDAGLDPDTAARVTMLSKDGVDTAYLASALAAQSRTQAPGTTGPSKSVEQRLQELDALKQKGLVNDEEFASQRQKILGSI